jgi:hypothetical protein
MRRLIWALALLGVLTLTAGASGAAAQTYGPGLNGNTWYGGYTSGPYGGVGASGYGSTGYGCGQGAYGFTQYGYGLAYALGPGMPQCGGFGSYPYLYPYTVGYPYANGVGAAGAIALSGMGNNNPFFGTTGCDGFALGTNVSPGAFFGPLPGPSQQFNALNNVNIFNVTNPALGAVNNFQTFGTTGLTGCVALR